MCSRPAPAPTHAHETPPPQADIVVAGSVALDLNCNFHNDRHPEPRPVAPLLYTSNPAGITQTIGGVGHNVALAAQSVHRALKVKLCSMVGSDR
jgi:pseudouridylate synthase / pseudouridine kinase